MIAAAAEGIGKVFAGRPVLRDVDLQVEGGEIHALLGANGSGKSTLVKILTGVYRPDGGTIVIGERRVASISSPHEANALGIAVVHQEAPLIDTFSIAECMAQFRGYPTRGGRIQWRRLNLEVAEILERFGLRIDPHQLAGKLTAAERALVAIVIALDRVRAGLKLLVLDEVTASLPRNQAEPYLDRVLDLARSGVGILMVTHRLAELHGRASSVTLLRDGAVAYAAGAGAVDDRRLVAEMIAAPGPSIPLPAGPRKDSPLRRLWSIRDPNAARRNRNGDLALEADDLTGETLRGLSFQVRSGEIVGIAGLAEGGVGELPRLLAGLKAPSGGRLRVNGRPLDPRATPRHMIAAGLVVLPADRLHSGGVATLSVADNVVLPDVRRYWMRPGRQAAVLDRLIEVFDIRPPSPATLFGKLSGGNQQKTILSKWLLLEPTVLVLDDPTNGVDPGAREKIFDRLRDASAEGVGVLVFSTEPEQLANYCSRVLILREGRIVHELAGVALDQQAISQWCYA